MLNKDNKRILVVDDEQMIRELYQHALEATGYQVDACEDGFTGTFSSWSDEYDLVILDYHMPVLNGLETLQHIRLQHPDLPVLVISGSLDDHQRKMIRSQPPADCMDKPVDIARLQTRVNEMLSAL